MSKFEEAAKAVTDGKSAYTVMRARLYDVGLFTIKYVKPGNVKIYLYRDKKTHKFEVEQEDYRDRDEKDGLCGEVYGEFPQTISELKKCKWVIE